MAGVATLIAQKLTAAVLGLSAVDYQADQSQNTQAQSEIVAFEIRVGNSSNGVVGSFDNKSGSPKWNKLTIEQKSRLKRVNKSFSQ